MDIKEMVNRAVSGDKEAFNVIIREFHNNLLSYVTSLCSVHTDPYDILQETYIKAYLKLESYNPTYPFDVWLKTIAHNTFIDVIRKESRTNISQFEDENPIITCCDRSPEEMVINHEHIKRVENEIGALPRSYQQIIELRYFQTLSYIEISEQLQIPIGTVKTRLHRAKKMLLNIEKTVVNSD